MDLSHLSGTAAGRNVIWVGSEGCAVEFTALELHCYTAWHTNSVREGIMVKRLTRFLIAECTALAAYAVAQAGEHRDRPRRHDAARASE